MFVFTEDKSIVVLILHEAEPANLPTRIRAWAASTERLGMMVGCRRSDWSSQNQDRWQMSTSPNIRNTWLHFISNKWKNTNICFFVLRVDLFVVVLIESQAEQIRRIFGGAVRLSAFLVLYVLKVKGRTVSVARGGPNQLRGPVWVAQNRLQFPNLGQNKKSICRMHTQI